jgi:ADP-L-glycero-D-manno-heptose 6-epimerase
MIVITGAAGFIGSCLAGRLNGEGYNDLVLVDDFSVSAKEKNYSSKTFSATVDRNEFHSWMRENHALVQFVFHLGARTDTTEFDKEIFDRLNLEYSKEVWCICVEFGLPLVYASSAATYGAGEMGYDDDENRIGQLKPLNPYGDSKNEFDKWAISQERKPYFWAGLKFFNVFGPNEYHKGRMASVVFHAFNQISQNGKVKLFRSHRPDFEDGRQLRDFIYVKDVTSVCFFLMLNRRNSGIFNLGSGKARSFLDLANATFESMNKPAVIEYIDIPADIRGKYQYFTEANMSKLRSIGYHASFYSLEDGIADYVAHYLVPHQYA